MEQPERGAGARALSLPDWLRSSGYCSFFWREVRLRDRPAFALPPFLPGFRLRSRCAQVFTFEGEEGLAVSRRGSGATGGKILKPILAISTIFFFFASEVRDRRFPLPRFLLSALANLRRRMLFRLSLSLSLPLSWFTFRRAVRRACRVWP